MSCHLFHLLVQKGIITKKEARKIFQESNKGDITKEFSKETEYLWSQYYDESQLD